MKKERLYILVYLSTIAGLYLATTGVYYPWWLWNL